MGTNDSSNPAQCPLELVEILKRLGAHHRKVHEQTYDHPPWTHEQSAAYWHHPVVWVCKWLEQRLAIDRDELMTAAFRLTTPQGLRGMAPLIAPDGEPDKEDKGQPDWLWMIPKFRELDRDGTTARDSTTTRLWRQLSEEYPTILVEAGIPVASQPPVVVPVDSLLAFTKAELMGELAKVIAKNKEKHWKPTELRLKILECNPGRTTSVKSIEKNLIYKNLLETQGRKRKRKIDPDVLHDVISQSLREHAAENGVRIRGRRIQSRD